MKTENINVRLSKEIKKEFKEFCLLKETNMSNKILDYVKMELNENKIKTRINQICYDLSLILNKSISYKLQNTFISFNQVNNNKEYQIYSNLIPTNIILSNDIILSCINNSKNYDEIITMVSKQIL